ncbi:MAG: hypothetical protein HRU19_05880 [Pseudobacteriovorax sp.]|nr:hypothetical protein [Pseudobacteriovorax sp.]
MRNLFFGLAFFISFPVLADSSSQPIASELVFEQNRATSYTSYWDVADFGRTKEIQLHQPESSFSTIEVTEARCFQIDWNDELISESVDASDLVTVNPQSMTITLKKNYQVLNQLYDGNVQLYAWCSFEFVGQRETSRSNTALLSVYLADSLCEQLGAGCE